MATLNREHNLTHERAAAIKPVAPDPGTALGVERCIGEIRELTPSLTGGR